MAPRGHADDPRSKAMITSGITRNFIGAMAY
jgi:hypothetical protein